jgi:hypothetical protein
MEVLIRFLVLRGTGPYLPAETGIALIWLTSLIELGKWPYLYQANFDRTWMAELGTRPWQQKHMD